RCYSDYMYAEYGRIDSDYVFVNLWAGRVGAPMTYAAVHELVDRIRTRVGFDFTLHMLRHTHATELIRSGVAIEVVARLLTHQSSTTTSQPYVHLDAADVRAALQRAGVWADGEGSGPPPARPVISAHAPRSSPAPERRWRPDTNATPGTPRCWESKPDAVAPWRTSR